MSARDRQLVFVGWGMFAGGALLCLVYPPLMVALIGAGVAAWQWLHLRGRPAGPETQERR